MHKGLLRRITAAMTAFFFIILWGGNISNTIVNAYSKYAPGYIAGKYDEDTKTYTVIGPDKWEMDDFDNGKEYPWNINKERIEHLIISDKVKRIGDNAFYGFKSLKQVTIGKNVESIGYSAFAGCTSLTEVNLPDSVTWIQPYAFADCTSLKEINIPCTAPNCTDSTKTPTYGKN